MFSPRAVRRDASSKRLSKARLESARRPSSASKACCRRRIVSSSGSSGTVALLTLNMERCPPSSGRREFRRGAATQELHVHLRESARIPCIDPARGRVSSKLRRKLRSSLRHADDAGRGKSGQYASPSRVHRFRTQVESHGRIFRATFSGRAVRAARWYGFGRTRRHILPTPALLAAPSVSARHLPTSRSEVVPERRGGRHVSRTASRTSAWAASTVPFRMRREAHNTLQPLGNDFAQLVWVTPRIVGAKMARPRHC